MDIHEAIDEKKKQIDKLEREITALQVAAKILEGTQPDKSKSQPEMAASILEEAGKPMHVSQLSEQIKKKFGKRIKNNNLGVMLFRYAQRGTRFYKVEGRPNTYGLLVWRPVPEEIAKLKAAS